ncbi:MAG: hypothetical protein ACP5KS_02970 [Candidatus Hydrogenedens sp.]
MVRENVGCRKRESEVLEKARKTVMSTEAETVEVPILSLFGESTYDEKMNIRELYISDLKKMEVGQEIAASVRIHRDGFEQSVKCLYKDTDGILLLETTKYWEDASENIYDVQNSDSVEHELIYIELH